MGKSPARAPGLLGCRRCLVVAVVVLAAIDASGGQLRRRQVCGEVLCNSTAAHRAPTGPRHPSPTELKGAGHQLLVLLGESPFRIAVADGWCHAYQMLPVCSVLAEIARETDPPAWLQPGRHERKCAVRERSACEALCSANKACWAHETYYCTKSMLDNSTITVAYVHHGFGVTPTGPFFHHGPDPRSSVAKVADALMREAVDSLDPRQLCAHWLPEQRAGEPDEWAATAHHDLVGSYIEALPRALGFKKVDALVLGTGYWDLARVRSIEHNVQALDDPQYMSWWLHRWSHNASRLLRVLQRTPNVARVLYMTAALSPAEKPQRSHGGKLFGFGTSSFPQRANPADFFFGDRIANINRAGRDVAKQLDLEVIDWECEPLIGGSSATEDDVDGMPWSSQMQDFIHPTTEAGVIMVEYTLRRLGWIDSSESLPFERPHRESDALASVQTELLYLSSVCGGCYLLRLCHSNRAQAVPASKFGSDTREMQRQGRKGDVALSRAAKRFDVRAALEKAKRQRLDTVRLASKSGMPSSQ